MFAAELLKQKGTLTLGLALFAPLMPPLLGLMVGLRNGKAPPPGVNPWGAATLTGAEVWSLLMLPLLVALQTALMANLETANAQWKHLHALPLSRVRLYLVKTGVAAAMLLLSTCTLLAGLLLAGATLGVLKPETQLLRFAPDWLALAGLGLRPFVAATFLLAISEWVSYRWSSMTVSLGVSVAGVCGVLVVTNDALGGRLFPWSMPFRAMRPDATDGTFILAFALVGFVAVTALGVWEASRREMV